MLKGGQEEEAVILKDEVVHKRFITVWDRTTEFKDGRVIKWDIVGHDTSYPTFVVVFTFDTKKSTTCILKEYCQGTNEMVHLIEESMKEAAKHELSEEAHLKGGKWIKLFEGEDGISELKWGKNKFIPFLCLDPVDDDKPMERDYEEHIDIIRDVSVNELKQFIMKGEMMLPSVQTAWMALDYLKLL
ncbi:hypothetical protein G6F57_003271 [Rhizopus arrhizus]|uniref:Nudix hydrolase domain-containing protein n=1 Tax=Rhizopus oryzae TaxID=64495 RepID=A0A9P6XFM4_RHIOR|nr:hypothetical protein G6F23_001455 [Rhizopus arrhizus]KAG1425601.1 hypothetical protein G6F58_001844 [Rhizopus delemar]KAG0766490.1 hypothetical protein G6F24_003573 [Rhizopus arrhizus]KAG0793980.1 hypothetical protein G6F21_003208 [Rhizopus arrhizus]KAG0802483.1 hypothetical protein G6F22_000209 [Rhizopus arrhizus]